VVHACKCGDNVCAVVPVGATQCNAPTLRWQRLPCSVLITRLPLLLLLPRHAALRRMVTVAATPPRHAAPRCAVDADGWADDITSTTFCKRYLYPSSRAANMW
jgi:hypothetical protein